MTTENQEIDLMKLASKFFSSIGLGMKQLVIYIFLTMKKYKFIYLICFICFIGIASLKFYNRSNTNSIRAYYTCKNKEIVESLVKTISYNFQNQNYAYLSNLMSVNPYYLSKISSIKTQKEVFKVGNKTEVSEGKLIQIPQPPIILYYFEVQIKEKFDYNILKQGLTNYFNKNEYLTKEVKLNLEKLAKTKEGLVAQLNQMKEYQTKILNNPNIKSIEIVGNNKIELANDKTMEDKILDLNDELFDVEQEISRNHDAIRFISEFSENKIDVLISSLGKLLVIFFGLALVLSVFFDFGKWLNKESKKI